MNDLPDELVLEIFEKICLNDYKTFIEYSKINKKFYFIYKKYFEEKIKEKKRRKGIYIYSFHIDPIMSYLPSGSVNMSQYPRSYSCSCSYV